MCAPQALVVGLPRVLRGGVLRATTQTLRCRQFAERLADAGARRGLRVWLSDENDSSLDAAAAMETSGVAQARQKTLLDAVAAAVILDNAFAQRVGPPEHVPPAKGVLMSAAPPRADNARLDWCVRAERESERGGAMR
jgi:hypothetical protein